MIDKNLGAVSTVSLSNANVVLSPSQYACGTIRLTGALTATVGIGFPSVQGWWVIDNQTTGIFAAIITCGGGQNIAVDQGTTADILTDGSNVKFRNLPAVGTYADVCDATVPLWITQCTVPPYLNCDGSTFSAVTYPYLAAKLGSTTLPDLRGVTRYTLNQGTSRLTTAGSGLDGNTRFSLKTTQAATLITANLPPYTPGGSLSITSSSNQLLNSNINYATGGNGLNVAQTPGAVSNLGPFTFSVSSSGSLVGTAQGGTSAPLGVVGPGTVAGITLIRAG